MRAWLRCTGVGTAFRGLEPQGREVRYYAYLPITAGNDSGTGHQGGGVDMSNPERKARWRRSREREKKLNQQLVIIAADDTAETLPSKEQSNCPSGHPQQTT